MSNGIKKVDEIQLAELAKRCCKIIDCDTARISQPREKMFLIIGSVQNTKDSAGIQWYKNGEPIDFEYVEERVVASGNTEDELLRSVIEYRRLCGMSIKAYLAELTKDGKQINEKGDDHV